MPDGPRLAVPIIYSQTQRSWPKHPDARIVRYLSLPNALTRAFAHDAHFAAYTTPQFPRRLSSEALTDAGRVQLPDGVPMVLATFDVDCALSHRANGCAGGAPAPDKWWLRELDKLDALAQAHPGAFAYRSRGGYRPIFRLATPYWLRTKADAEAWAWQYTVWCAYLRRAFGIIADPSCADWTRLYRLPHATRVPGGAPEAREYRGNPYTIGTWTCEPTEDDIQLAPTLRKRAEAPRITRPRHTPSVYHLTARASVLFYAFQARGWLSDMLEPGKWAVACPWEDRHTKGERFDTSTILFAPGDGETLGWLHCSHAHCQTRDMRDVLAVFTTDELRRASEAAGLIAQRPDASRCAPRVRDVIGGRRSIRTVAAEEVTPCRA